MSHDLLASDQRTLGTQRMHVGGKMTSTALIILNPRAIPYCISALEALDIPKVWLSYMVEVEAARQANKAIEATSFDRYVVISDDCEPTQEALDLVLALHDEGHPVVTGYSNFDAHRDEDGVYTAKLPYVNLCAPRVLPPPPPTLEAYGLFMTRAQVDVMSDPILTAFAGLSFTLMSRDMWLKFPLHPTMTGGQMDYQLSWQLQEAHIPIVAAPGAFVWHCKDEFGIYPDRLPEKQLLIGQRPAAVTWTDLVD